MTNNRKFVLYIGGFELPDKNAAAQRVVANAKIFIELGYDVFLIGLTKSTEHANSEFEYQGLRCLNISYPKGILGWLGHLFAIKKYFRSLSLLPNIIIAYNFPAMALYRLWRWSKKHEVKIVADCTEWYQPKGNLLHRLIKGGDVSLRMKFVQPKLDGLIVISSFLYKYYQNRSVNLLLLPPLVDKNDNKWNIARGDFVPSDEIRFVYAGSPGAGNKDKLDLIINALVEIKRDRDIDLTLDIIGIYVEEYKRIYVTDDCLPKYIHFLGRLSHQKVLSYLVNSDFQIFVRECNLANTAGFPTKFVESISSGTLVLTNYSSDLAKYLVDGVNGFSLEISSKKELINSLLKVLAFSKEQVSEIKKGIDIQIFDYRKYITSTREFVDKL